MKHKILKMGVLLAPLMVAGLLAACDGTGYNKTRPNEFNVRTNPPLIVPPNYNLRPPLEAAESEDEASRPEVPASAIAKALTLPNQKGEAEKKIDPEAQTILDRAGGKTIYSDAIRDEIDSAQDDN